jgi:hypothetical protein
MGRDVGTGLKRGLGLREPRFWFMKTETATIRRDSGRERTDYNEGKEKQNLQHEQQPYLKKTRSQLSVPLSEKESFSGLYHNFIKKRSPIFMGLPQA